MDNLLSNPFFIFFIIIAFLFIILICIYLVPIINYLKNINNKSQLILKGPIFLNTQTEYLINTPPLANYTFTFWIYVNNYTNNHEIPIFNYSDYCPFIVLKNDLLNNICFYPSSYYFDKNKPIKFNIKTQKWNFIVIQYIKNTVEFYLNSVLIYSLSFDNNNINTKPIYDKNHILTIGDNNIISNGIGAISNINYYSNNLTAKEIKFEYELNISQNQPF